MYHILSICDTWSDDTLSRFMSGSLVSWRIPKIYELTLYIQQRLQHHFHSVWLIQRMLIFCCHCRSLLIQVFAAVSIISISLGLQIIKKEKPMFKSDTNSMASYLLLMRSSTRSYEYWHSYLQTGCALHCRWCYFSLKIIPDNLLT